MQLLSVRRFVQVARDSGSSRGFESSTDDPRKLMVSSQSQSGTTEQHGRGCHRGRNSDASDSEKSGRATVQKRPHGFAEPPYDCLSCLYMYLSDRTLSLRTVRSPLRRYLRYCIVSSLPTPIAASTVDHSRPDCLISGDQQSQDRRTKLSASGKQ